MRIFNEWKAKQREQSLLTKIRSRKIDRYPMSFEQAQTVGLLFDATDPHHRNIVRQYAEELKNKDKEVTLFAFLQENESNPNFAFKHFTKKDLNWIGYPNDEAINGFVNQSFDFLINLYLDQQPALEYVSGLSHAHLRVGPYSEKLHCYDLMIDTSRQPNLDFFVKHVSYFLNRLKNSSRA